jgi:hypothetical protein
VDWVPSLPVSVGPSFIGWPPYLLEAATIGGTNLLLARSRAATTERQWKGFLSWMLGVVGTRHVLNLEGYRWIAPVSAFYGNAVQTVDLSAWNPSFPRSVLRADRPRGSRIRLYPDYLALRRRKGRFQWAVAEAKGTTSCLTERRVCPTSWSRQARNVQLAAFGAPITVHRHLVVATRVNPNGINPPTRRLSSSRMESPS